MFDDVRELVFYDLVALPVHLSVLQLHILLRREIEFAGILHHYRLTGLVQVGVFLGGILLFEITDSGLISLVPGSFNLHYY